MASTPSLICGTYLQNCPSSTPNVPKQLCYPCFPIDGANGKANRRSKPASLPSRDPADAYGCPRTDELMTHQVRYDCRLCVWKRSKRPLVRRCSQPGIKYGSFDGDTGIRVSFRESIANFALRGSGHHQGGGEELKLICRCHFLSLTALCRLSVAAFPAATWRHRLSLCYPGHRSRLCPFVCLGVNGRNRIYTHGAPRRRMMPNGSL